MAKALYTEADLKRWDHAHRSDYRVYSRFIRKADGNLAFRQGSGLFPLALSHRGLGRTAIARHEFPLALGHFMASCDLVSLLFEVYFADGDISAEYIGTGHFQTLLLAHVTGDERVIQRFLSVYRRSFDEEKKLPATRRDPKDSRYIGSILVALADHRLDEAIKLLSKPIPRMDKQFEGYVECLRAINTGDAVALRAALGYASESWERFSRRNRGLSDTVCFLAGVGFIRLFQRLWDKPVEPGVPHIPYELLQPIKPAKVEPIEGVDVSGELRFSRAKPAGQSIKAKTWWQFWK